MQGKGRIRRAAGMLMLASMAVASSAWAQVLKQVPDTAVVVIKVKDVADASKKIGKFMEDIGVAALQPQAADPLGNIKQMSNVSQGLNENGEFAWVYVDPSVSGVREEESMMAYIPVSDYDAFLKNFTDVKTEGQISTANIEGDDAYIVHWGEYAVMSPVKALVATAPTAAIKITGLTAKEMDESDISVFANTPRLAAMSVPELDNAEAALIRELQQNGGNDPELAKFQPVIAVAVHQFIGLSKGFLNDGEGATLGLHIGAEGLKFTQVTQFANGSESAKVLGGLNNVQTSMLQGLPEASYLMYGGLSVNSASVTTSIHTLVDPIVTELKKIDDPKVKAGLTYLDAAMAVTSNSSGETFGMLAPTAPLMQGPLIQVVAIVNGDAKKLSEAQVKMAKAQGEFMDMIGEITKNPMKMSFTEGAKTVAGVSFNEVKSEFDPAAAQQSRDVAEFQSMMSMMYGPAGAANYTGVVNDSSLLTVAGLSDEDIAKAIGSIKANSDTVIAATPVQAVAAQLPKSRAGVFYIALDNIINTTSNYMAQSGMPFKMQLPPDLQPVGMSLASEGSAMRVDVYVPTETVQSIISGALTARQGMMGGPGGPGGPPPGGAF